MHWAAPSRAAVVVPEGFLYQRYVAARVKAKLLSDFNLHTIVKLPVGTFAPYTPTPTSILFFDNSKETDDVWFYEQKPPAGRKRYTKTNPIAPTDFTDLKKWWVHREATAEAWLGKVDDLVTYVDGQVTDVNLAQKNPSTELGFVTFSSRQALVSTAVEEGEALDALHSSVVEAIELALPAEHAIEVTQLLEESWKLGLSRLAPIEFASVAKAVQRMAFLARSTDQAESMCDLGDLGEFLNGRSYDTGLIAETGTPIIRISNMTDPSSKYLYTSEAFPSDYMVDEG